MKVGRIITAFAALILLISTPAAAATGKDVLKIATWEDVNTFDPGWLTSGERELTIMTCLYNGLVRYKPGSWEIEADLAESWEESPDGKSITFHLKKGVLFHKGYGEMTAEDVKFSFERIIDPNAKSTEKGLWKNLDRVEVVDKYTVRLVLKERMVNLFTSILPMNAGMIVSKKAVEKMGQAKFGFNPVGTGPYELSKWEPKKQVLLKAFGDYTGPKPAVSRVSFMPIVEDATCETALKTGEIHFGRASLINVDSFKKDPRFNLVSKPAMKTYWLGMTVNRAPFDNLKLRQAFRHAVDVDKIILAAYYGTAHRANTVLPPAVPGFWKDAPAYKKDIAKAKQLMKEAGKPDGFKVDLLIWASDDARIMSEVIKADAAEAGIDVKIVVKEIGAYNDAINKGLSDAYIQFYTATIDPTYIMRWFAGKDWNPSQWRNTKYADLMTRGAAEKDQAKRAGIFMDAQKEIDKDCWAVWLTNGAKVLIGQDSVDMGKIYPDGRLTPWTMSFK